MQSIHFSVRPYRNYENKVSNEFICLCLVTDDGTIIESQEVRTDAWRNNEHECREYWKHTLLTRVKDKLLKASDAHGYICNKEHRLVLDDATYDD